MKAIVIAGQYGIDHLQTVERPVPEPRRGEVVIKMHAAALNYRDLEIVRGSYHTAYPLPLVPLSDGVGTVAAVGEGVTRVRPGDRVAAMFWQQWIDGACLPVGAVPLGGPLDGVLAEYVRLDQEGVAPVPSCLSDEEAATLPLAALTAWHALMTGDRLAPGENVLIQGTGGVSLFALQFAVAAGARAIVTSSSDAKLERARALGASEVVNYRATPDWHETVLAATHGAGVDHVVEVGGAESLAKSLRALSPGGQIHVVGYLGGTDGVIDPLDIFRRRARVRGISVGSRASFEAMCRAVALQALHPVIDMVLPWTDVAEGLRRLEGGGNFGKIVLRFR
jgi:NADPH:quinone reductase-like Zn-dependent oxidoreductase